MRVRLSYFQEFSTLETAEQAFVPLIVRRIFCASTGLNVFVSLLVVIVADKKSLQWDTLKTFQLLQIQILF